MGETPTHGKIKVSLSPRISGGSSSTETSLDGSDRDGGDGPLDVSGRSNCAGTGNETFKTVEWYGTIRLLVFARKGASSFLRSYAILYLRLVNAENAAMLLLFIHITAHGVFIKIFVGHLHRVLCPWTARVSPGAAH